MARETIFGIKIQADSKDAEGALKRIGEGAQKVSQAGAKMAGVMNVASTALGGMGGAGAQAASQLTGVIGMLGTGGPLAVGMVALTSVIAAGAQAWKAWNLEADLAEDVAIRVADAFQKNFAKRAAESTARVSAMADEVAKLNEAMNPGATVIDMMNRRDTMMRNLSQLEGDARRDVEQKIRLLQNEIQGSLKLEATRRDAADKAAATKRAEEQLAKSIEATAKAEEMAMNASKLRWEEEKAARQAANDAAKTSGDEFMRREAERNDLIRKLDQRVNDDLKRNAEDRFAHQVELTNKETQNAEDEAAKRREIAGAVNDVITGLAQGLTATMDSESAERTTIMRVAAVAQIAINTAVAIAEAIAAGADKPWPLNLAAIASGVAAVGAAFAAIGSFAEGGFVSGGKMGRDSVPARLMPGEYVMSRGEVSGFSMMLRRFGAASGMAQAMLAGPQLAMAGASGSSRGGTPSIQIINQIWQPDTVGMARMTRRQAQTTKRLSQQGMLKR